MKLAPFVSFLIATIVHGATLPGFSVRPVATAPANFISSIVTNSAGILYYTTTSGDIVRVDSGASTIVAHVQTIATGNSGLLGMALAGDTTAIVHYTTPLQTYDLVSSIDLVTGIETTVHAFICNLTDPNLGASAEHHGGNPIIARDGSIFVSIGDGNDPNVAPITEWNLGKIFRIFPDGNVRQYARGVRNPFDLSWDAANNRLIVPDNGDKVNDEINIVRAGDNLGWPYTMGDQNVIEGDLKPVYVFPTVVAPTGIVALSGRNPMLRHGYLLASFVTKAVYYIADIDAPDPIPLIQKETESIVDVTESNTGDVYFTTGRTIYQLVPPLRGDCNADNLINADDLTALLAAIAKPAGASWGCDVNGDGLIDSADIAALKTRLTPRVRAVKRS